MTPPASHHAAAAATVAATATITAAAASDIIIAVVAMISISAPFYCSSHAPLSPNIKLDDEGGVAEWDKLVDQSKAARMPHSRRGSTASVVFVVVIVFWWGHPGREWQHRHPLLLSRTGSLQCWQCASRRRQGGW